MNLETRIMEDIKAAMRAKDAIALESLRAIKSVILLAKTEGGTQRDSISEEEEIKILQKLVKQRKDAATQFSEQNRPELAEKELLQSAVIEKFLPQALSLAEVKAEVKIIVEELGAKSMADMGKVMTEASKRLMGKTDGKTLSEAVKQSLA